MAKKQTKQNSKLTSEQAIKRFFVETEVNEKAKNKFQEKLETQLFIKAEEINQEKGLGVNKLADKKKEETSFLGYFSLIFSSFTAIVVIVGGVALYVYVNNKQNDPSNIATNPDTTVNVDNNNNNNFGSENTTGLGAETILKPLEKAVVCEDICDSQVAYDIVRSKFSDNYSFQASLTYSNISSNNFEYYYFFTNRGLGTNVVRLNDNSSLSVENTINQQYLNKDNMNSDFVSKTNADIVTVLDSLNTRYGGKPSMSLSKTSDGKILKLVYPSDSQNTSVDIITVEIYTDKDLSPNRMLISLFSSSKVLTSYYNYQYLNYNVANNTINSTKLDSLKSVDSVSMLLQNVTDIDSFKMSADISDNSQNTSNYREWGEGSKLSEGRFDADVKTYSINGMYEYRVVNDTLQRQTFDFPTSTWGGYSPFAMPESLIDGYAIDFSPVYTIKKYTSGTFAVTAFNSYQNAVAGYMVYTVSSRNTLGDTFEGTFWVDGNGKFIRQDFTVNSGSGKLTEKINFFNR